MTETRPEGPPGALATIGANVVRTGQTEAVVLTAQVANASSVGSTFRVRAAGTTTVLGNPFVRIRVGAAGTVADAQAWLHVAATGILNTVVFGEWLVTVKTVGATGTVNVEGLVFNGAAALTRTAAAPATVTVNTLAPWSITLTSAMSIAAGSMTWTNGIIEKRY